MSATQLASPALAEIARDRDQARANVRDGFLLGLGESLGLTWPSELLSRFHTARSFADCALAEIACYRKTCSEADAGARRADLVDAWQFLAAIERLRCAVEDGETAQIVAAARWVVRR